MSATYPSVRLVPLPFHKAETFSTLPKSSFKRRSGVCSGPTKNNEALLILRHPGDHLNNSEAGRTNRGLRKWLCQRDVIYSPKCLLVSHVSVSPDYKLKFEGRKVRAGDALTEPFLPKCALIIVSGLFVLLKRTFRSFSVHGARSIPFRLSLLSPFRRLRLRSSRTKRH
jgi:hypothetical protein